MHSAGAGWQGVDQGPVMSGDSVSELSVSVFVSSAAQLPQVLFNFSPAISKLPTQQDIRLPVEACLSMRSSSLLP